MSKKVTLAGSLEAVDLPHAITKVLKLAEAHKIPATEIRSFGIKYYEPEGSPPVYSYSLQGQEPDPSAAVVTGRAIFEEEDDVEYLVP